MTETIAISSLSSEAKKRLSGVITEVCGSLTRVDGEIEFQKEAIEKISEELGVDKKLVRKIAKTKFDGSFEDMKEKNEEFESSYALLVGFPE